jgi:hypothetical protein
MRRKYSAAQGSKVKKQYPESRFQLETLNPETITI